MFFLRTESCRRVGVGAGKWRKYWEKWPGNEKRQERSLSAFWRLVLGLVFPQKNKKLPEEDSNLKPDGSQWERPVLVATICGWLQRDWQSTRRNVKSPSARRSELPVANSLLTLFSAKTTATWKTHTARQRWHSDMRNLKWSLPIQLRFRGRIRTRERA